VQGNWLNLPHCVEMQNHQNLGNNTMTTMTTLNPSTLTEPLKKTIARQLAYVFYIAGVVTAVMGAAILISA
jgi:hypothetical protein